MIGRHAYGDQYRATDFLVPGSGKLFLKEEGFIKKSDLNEIHWAKNSKQVISFVKNYHK